MLSYLLPDSREYLWVLTLLTMWNLTKEVKLLEFWQYYCLTIWSPLSSDNSALRLFPCSLFLIFVCEPFHIYGFIVTVFPVVRFSCCLFRLTQNFSHCRQSELGWCFNSSIHQLQCFLSIIIFFGSDEFVKC